MRSAAQLTIAWQRPELQEEAWEFTGHPAKQPYYVRHGIRWEALLAASEHGTLVPWPRGEVCCGVSVQLSFSAYDDYLSYLHRAPRNYRLNYLRLEQTLQRNGSLLLPAPVVLCCNGEGLLFSGWRRLCLAWNYGMVPYVWMVTLFPDADR